MFNDTDKGTKTTGSRRGQAKQRLMISECQFQSLNNELGLSMQGTSIDKPYHRGVRQRITTEVQSSPYTERSRPGKGTNNPVLTLEA